MLVSEMRTRLRSAVLRGSTSYSDAEIDYALQSALQDLDLSARVQREVGQVTMTVNNPQVDLSSICGFRPDRMVRAETAFTFKGAWTAGTSYSPVDMVSQVTPGPGFYVCTVANTASSGNQPGTSGGNGYWEYRAWKRGDKIELETYETVAAKLGDSDWRYFDWSNLYWLNQGMIMRGRPIALGMLDQNIGYLFPVPINPWKLAIIQESPIDEWVAGQANPDIELPQTVLLPLIDLGAAAALEPATSDGEVRARKWEVVKGRLRGKVIIANGIAEKNPVYYRDHTDNRSGWYPRL